MPSATLTSKGQLTVPKRIREMLKLETGDTVEFVVGEDGTVEVRAGNYDVRELRGLLKRPGRKPVSLQEMDAAIAGGRRRQS
ncbi:MAG TPA: type II toxin-antitoxin system PrlF family antitoxin [Vicinamibacterales bacterium]|nr:type II toxin-antitoxin system PrlF family antitoxin [Vicinamibacterales bacterium]